MHRMKLTSPKRLDLPGFFVFCLYIEIAHVQMFYEASAIVEVHGPVTDPQELRAKQFIRRIRFTQDVHKACCCYITVVYMLGIVRVHRILWS